MQRMPADKAARLNGLVGELRGLPRIAAIALGGSQARGLQRPDSDIDIGLYYREEEAFEPAPLRQLATRLDDAGQPVVTELHEWGRWVNGGAWLSVGGDRVDILYRNIGQIERCIAEAECGRVLLDFDQQPPYGFSSVVYLAEVAACVALDDPQGILARLKERVAVYPPELKEGIINGHLWLAEFTLRYAVSQARRGDAYNTVGCLTRCASYMTRALFALNETYFMTDKTALDELEGFRYRPPRYGARIGSILAAPGADADALSSSLGAMTELLEDAKLLCGRLYRPRY